MRRALQPSRLHPRPPWHSELRRFKKILFRISFLHFFIWFVDNVTVREGELSVAAFIGSWGGWHLYKHFPDMFDLL